MPQRTKKEHKCSHHTAEGSRWHNFHFSGKVIVCSVILGFMLILVGGILMAIGMDRDEDTKSDKYEDLQKKPPMVYVGPAIMGIGGFAVIVGVLMCLIETKVCRKRNPDSSPLINSEVEQTEIKDSDGAVRDTNPTAIPSTSRQHHDKHQNGVHKKSPSTRKSKGSSKKHHSSNQKVPNKSATQLSPPSDAGEGSSKNFLTASDKFVTPPSSFADDVPGLVRNKDNQATTSLMQSFTSSGKSWNTSTEFQTPSASFIDDPLSLQFMEKRQEEMSSNANHKFLTPQNSDIGVSSAPQVSNEKEVQELGGTVVPKDNSSCKQNIQEKTNSSKVSAPVDVTEDGGKESNQTVGQEKVTYSGESEVLNDKNSSTGEIDPMEKKQSHLNSPQLETNENLSVSEGSNSDAASSEENENCVENNTHVGHELLNKNINENICDSINDVSTVSNPEEYSTETSGSKISSDGANSGEITEDASVVNSMDSKSINEQLQEASPETTSQNSEVDAPVETVDTPT